MKCSIQLGYASLNGTFHLSPHENICTIALINIHYLYNSFPDWKRTCDIGPLNINVRSDNSVNDDYGVTAKVVNGKEGPKQNDIQNTYLIGTCDNCSSDDI